MTPVEFAYHVRFMTKTTSGTFTDAQILALMKLRQDEIALAILDVDEDILLIPQYTNLVPSSITAREYPQPPDILSRIKRVEAKLDGTNYIVLNEFDVTSYRKSISTEASIIANFSNLEGGAFFDIIRKSIFIYSGTLTAVTDGLKILVNTYPAAITDLALASDLSQDPSTTTHGIPRAMHEIWARGVIIDYKSSREKPIPLSERELSYEKDLGKKIKALKHGNLDREVIGELPDASDRGNDGFDY